MLSSNDSDGYDLQAPLQPREFLVKGIPWQTSRSLGRATWAQPSIACSAPAGNSRSHTQRRSARPDIRRDRDLGRAAHGRPGHPRQVRRPVGRQDHRRHHQPAEPRDLRLPGCARGQLESGRARRALPSSKVLKAFNTTFAATLGAKAVGPNKTTVLVAGDDADAKAALMSAIQAGGVDAIDAGALTRARELEAIGFLQLTLAAGEKLPWTGGFAVVR